MTCLADGLRKLATRNSMLRTPGILPSQTIAQISIAQYNITASSSKTPKHSNQAPKKTRRKQVKVFTTTSNN